MKQFQLSRFNRQGLKPQRAPRNFTQRVTKSLRANSEIHSFYSARKKHFSAALCVLGEAEGS